MKVTALPGRAGEVLIEESTFEAFEGWIRSSAGGRSHVMREKSMCKGMGVMQEPGYLGNGEKFNVAEVQSRWNGVGVGDGIRKEESLKFLSNH